MAEHELDDPDVDTVGQQPACAFMPQVVTAEIDPLELLAISRGAFATGPRLVAVREQLQRFPGGLDVRLVGSRRRPEDECIRSKGRDEQHADELPQ